MRISQTSTGEDLESKLRISCSLTVVRILGNGHHFFLLRRTSSRLKLFASDVLMVASSDSLLMDRTKLSPKLKIRLLVYSLSGLLNIWPSILLLSPQLLLPSDWRVSKFDIYNVFLLTPYYSLKNVLLTSNH